MPETRPVAVWFWLIVLALMVVSIALGYRLTVMDERVETLQRQLAMSREETVQTKAGAAELERLASGLQANLDKAADDRAAVQSEYETVKTERQALEDQIAAAAGELEKARPSKGAAWSKHPSIQHKRDEYEKEFGKLIDDLNGLKLDKKAG